MDVRPLPDDDRELADAYAFPQGSTCLRVTFVASADGAAAGGDGRSASLAPDGDARVFGLQRSLADVVLVASGTARAESYEPVRPDEVDGDLRHSLGLAPLPPIAVVTGSLDVPEALLDAGDGARTIVITHGAVDPDRLEQVRTRADVVVVGDDDVDLVAAVAELEARGLRRIACEGGPSLHGRLLAAGLVDELCLTVAPALVGGDAPRIATGGTADPPVDLRLRHVLVAGDALMLRYDRVPAVDEPIDRLA